MGCSGPFADILKIEKTVSQEGDFGQRLTRWTTKPLEIVFAQIDTPPSPIAISSSIHGPHSAIVNANEGVTTWQAKVSTGFN
jgi:hypothetical protein